MLYNLLYAVLRAYKFYSYVPTEKDSLPFHILTTCMSVTEHINFLHALCRNPGQDKVDREEGQVAGRGGLAAWSKGSMFGVSQLSLSEQTLKTLGILRI